MRVRRDISAIPYRSAGETWQDIVDLVTGQGLHDTSSSLRTRAGRDGLDHHR